MFPPRALVAPDAFKGTFSAAEVADAVARGLERAGVAADRCPLADGGEGTQAALLAARGGRVVEAPAHDPLGRPLTASFALLGDDGRTPSWRRPPRAGCRCCVRTSATRGRRARTARAS
jgi:glycerate kinase